MTPETLNILLIVIVVVLAGFALFARQQRDPEATITPSVVLEEIKMARPLAVELAEIVQIAVNSVEQLRREGKIQSNDVAFNRALDIAKKWIPDEWEVDNEDLINTINSAVLVASSLRREAGRSSELPTTGVEDSEKDLGHV